MRRQGLDIGLLSTEIPDWYREMGWECCGEQCTFTLDRTSISYLPRIENMMVRGWSDNDVQGMHVLYGRQAGALRSVELMRSFLGRTGIQGYVAHREAELVAYAIAIRGEIVEVRGEVDHALSLLREIYPQALFGRQQYLLINLPAKRDALSHHLRRLGLPMFGDYLGMIWIASARSLLKKVAPRIVVDRRRGRLDLTSRSRGSDNGHAEGAGEAVFRTRATERVCSRSAAGTTVSVSPGSGLTQRRRL